MEEGMAPGQTFLGSSLLLRQGPEEHPLRLHSKSERRPSSAFAGSEAGAPQRPSTSGRQSKEAEDACPPFPLVPLLKASYSQHACPSYCRGWFSAVCACNCM